MRRERRQMEGMKVGDGGREGGRGVGEGETGKERMGREEKGAYGTGEERSRGGGAMCDKQ